MIYCVLEDLYLRDIIRAFDLFFLFSMTKSELNRRNGHAESAHLILISMAHVKYRKEFELSICDLEKQYL